MANLSINFRILEQTSTIKSRMEKALVQEILKSTRNKLLAIKNNIGIILKQIIQNSVVWQSIESGFLRGDFGIPLTTNLDGLLDIWSQNILVTIQGQNLQNIRIQILGIKSDFTDVLASPISEYISAPSAETIPWLRWILLEGSTILIDNYRVQRNLSTSQRRVSRTGQAVMQRLLGTNYHVPVELAGTQDSNFITRELDRPSSRSLISETIIRILQK